MAQPSAPSAIAPEPFLDRTFAGRLDGIDVARALAFGGMLLAHFARPMRPGDPGWLQALDNIADGRAAPLFCMLLGVGAGILVTRGTPDRVLVQRGLALFVIGLAIWPRVDRVYLILPHYGVLLSLVPLLRRLSTRALLPVAAFAFVVPSVITAIVDGHGLRGSSQPATYDALLDSRSLLGQLFWTGGYPVVGWVGFVLIGLWMARQPLQDRVTQLRLFAGSGAVMLLQPIAAVVFRRFDGRLEDPNARGWSAFFDGTAHS
ncbi:MAG: heparan-alpha-glucosaminide N-acetyltransferase domain-containing protein, partial [Acidimicrobiia bacterium]